MGRTWHVLLFSLALLAGAAGAYEEYPTAPTPQEVPADSLWLGVRLADLVARPLGTPPDDRLGQLLHHAQDLSEAEALRGMTPLFLLMDSIKRGQCVLDPLAYEAQVSDDLATATVTVRWRVKGYVSQPVRRMGVRQWEPMPSFQRPLIEGYADWREPVTRQPVGAATPELAVESLRWLVEAPVPPEGTLPEMLWAQEGSRTRPAADRDAALALILMPLRPEDLSLRQPTRVRLYDHVPMVYGRMDVEWEATYPLVALPNGRWAIDLDALLGQAPGGPMTYSRLWGEARPER
ncbi:MAG: hypothetical protein GF320_13355 [Armatimonadia bacterium]|nr:hypothetical protein [Armatimonadia bacterium]